MPSELTFSATEGFRKNLLKRNLPPYTTGYRGNETAGKKELSLKDRPPYNNPDIEDLAVTDSSQELAYIQNIYGPEGGYDDLIDIDDVHRSVKKQEEYYTFIASTYNAFNLLTVINANGNNGSLSEDSELTRIAAKQLKTQFQYRIGEEIKQQTLGRINVLDALSDPFDALAIATGREQLIESDWKISVPDNIVGKGLDFLSRISGVYSPYSWIPGNYFNEVIPQSSINQSVESGDFSERGTVLPQANTRSSEQFLSSTGRGQTKRLFKSLDLNVYAPDYTENSRAFGLKPPPGNYYIGSKQNNPTNFSREDELPIDQYGNRVRGAVRGYYEIAKDYENKISSNFFKFGLNGTNYLRSYTYTNNSYDSRRIEGGFTWVSTDSIESAGKRAKEGGDDGTVDTNWTASVKSSWDGTVSTGYGFTPGSILDDTQRLIDSAPKKGLARLQHVGNAIDQVSKVFNDGVREMTKGSMVYQYTDNETGLPVGVEYCRVFTKDTPYFFNSDLQKGDGITTQGRRFTNSILDNTYNLNIAPWKDSDSTNIQESKVKKYMFSIENLAWRTSSKKGFTYQDLPVCERGPNGGRIMWFPPYDMKVSEQNSTNWTANEFLGRPEPIYTYNNTTRQGSLSWKIVVDHPSILNDIVKKQLQGENAQRINDVIDSFYSGCKKYDINELAETYPELTVEEITELVEKITDVKGFKYWEEQIQSPGDPVSDEPVIEDYTNKINKEDYKFEFYFDNDIPPKTSSTDQDTTQENYSTSIGAYIGRRDDYFATANEENKIPVDNFYETYITTGDSGFNLIEYKTKILAQKIRSAIDDGAMVNITLKGSASAPNSVAYNEHLSKRRIDSVKKYLLTFSELSKFEDKLKINASAKGKQSVATPGGSDGPFNCVDEFDNETDGTYSVRAMACRAVVFENIEEIPPPPDEESKEPPVSEEPPIITTVTGRTPYTYQKVEYEEKVRYEVTETITKKLLTECDYFNMMREEHPRVYQGIEEKIKFFQPVFHSMTPEGLNSRLTFLQQCLRPGDTIPVIGEDGKPREGDVKNTAFGAPPICVLRIGDFYHTKIAINQMSINYEPLTFDLNPEGIGVQPMIADVNISFYFIGGQGIEEPVSRLQNALSFNYFANTEVYDDRSIDTETRKEITADDIEQINNAAEKVTDSKVEIPEEAGDTIGEVIGTRLEGDYAAGDIIYKSAVKDLVIKAQAYTQNILNTLDTINRNQNSIGMYYFTQSRGYKDGQITGYLDDTNELSTNIFGKPVNIEDKIIGLSTELLKDISDNTNPFLSSISLENFKNSDIRKFKKNLRAFVQQYIAVFPTFFNESMFDLLEIQTELVRIIDKFNLVTTNTDGFKGKSGRISILELSGTSEVDVSSNESNTADELLADIQTVGFDLQAFYDEIFEDNGLLPEKNNLYKGFLSGSFDTEPQTRFCSIAFKAITSVPEYVINLILGEELSQKPEWVQYVNKIVYGTPEIPNNLPDILGSEGTNQPILPATPGLIDVYNELKNKSNKAFDEFKDNENVKKFTLYQPFNLDKERKFNYIQKYQEQLSSQTKVDYFNTTFKGINGGTIISYNEKYTFN